MHTVTVAHRLIPSCILHSFFQSHSLNKELVNQGLVSWYEGYTDPADPVEVPDLLEPYPLQDEEIPIPQEPTDGAQLQV